MALAVHPEDVGKLTDILEKKAKFVFAVLDVDKKGAVEWADFQQVAERSRGAATLEARCRAAWDALREGCDLQQNGRVTIQNWLAFWGAAAEYIQLNRELPAPLERLARVFFDSLSGGNNVVSKERFAQLLQSPLVQGAPSKEVADQIYTLFVPPGCELDFTLFRRWVLTMVASIDEGHPSLQLMPLWKAFLVAQ